MKSIKSFKYMVLNSRMSSIYSDNTFGVYNKIVYCPSIIWTTEEHPHWCSLKDLDCPIFSSGNIKGCPKVGECNEK